jgi:glycosyltransferase involved in cell wall biosynthesis
MKKKKILVDLSILRNLHCGLGQIAYNYGKYFRDHYKENDQFEVYLFLPKEMEGVFGSKIKYITINWWRKHFPFLLPKFDVWHSIHQLSHYRPYRKDMKYVLTIHDLNFMYEKSKFKQNRILSQLQREVNRADKIICISEFSKSETLRYLDLKDKKVDVIFNGVEQFETHIAQKPNFIKSNKPFFFSIGEIKRKKNFHVLLPLMKLYPDKELYIAGQNVTRYANEILNQIETLSLTNVHLVGKITHEERIWLYHHCEAFLFPSLFEGFGLPVIEAMSFGKPVFSSRETSLKEIGGDCAFFWDNFEPEHMKELIENQLTAFHNSPELSKKNIDYATTFSYELHMKRYMSIYRQLST